MPRELDLPCFSHLLATALMAATAVAGSTATPSVRYVDRVPPLQPVPAPAELAELLAALAEGRVDVVGHPSQYDVNVVGAMSTILRHGDLPAGSRACKSAMLEPSHFEPDPPAFVFDTHCRLRAGDFGLNSGAVGVRCVHFTRPSSIDVPCGFGALAAPAPFLLQRPGRQRSPAFERAGRRP